MATVTAHTAAHSSLTASTVETVNLDGSQTTLIRNRSTSIDFYYTFSAGGTAATPAAANDSYICPAGQTINLAEVTALPVTQVKLFSTGTPAYSVEQF